MSAHDHDWVNCDFDYDTDYEPPVQQCVRCAEYRHDPTVSEDPNWEQA